MDSTDTTDLLLHLAAIMGLAIAVIAILYLANVLWLRSRHTPPSPKKGLEEHYLNLPEIENKLKELMEKDRIRRIKEKEIGKHE